MLGPTITPWFPAIYGGGSAPPSVPTFEFTVKTDNAGTSTNVQFTVPTVASGTYDCHVDWGDGNSDDITTWNDAAWTHTYSSAGTYTVKITGASFKGFQFGNTGDKLKFLNVSSWGILVLCTNGAFFGCSNFTSTQAFPASTLDAALTDTVNMFFGCSAFNQDLNSWDVSAVTNMQNTFFGCSAFNQDLDSWDVSAVTIMQSMFYNCSAFNGDISSWNVAAVANMLNMFVGCSTFNGDISSWDVSAVTSMQSMFYNCYAFNQDIGSWDVAAVTDMLAMFNNCSAFDQDLSSWVVSAVTNFTNFMSGVTLSTANYDALLIGWEALDLVDSLSCHFGNSTYSAGAAAAARAAIIADDLWTITDGGPA